MRGDLIVILCKEDHTISFVMITEQDTLQLISKRDVFEDDENAPVTYADIVLVRNSKNAYQIFL
jgi:hypothetical protein